MDERDGILPQECPYCGYHIDAATCVSDSHARPIAGDLTLCMRCAGLLEFNNAGRIVPKNERDIEPEQLREIQRVQSVIRQVQHIHKRRN